MRDELTGLLLALAVVGCGTAGSDDREPLGKMVTEIYTCTSGPFGECNPTPGVASTNLTSGYEAAVGLFSTTDVFGDGLACSATAVTRSSAVLSGHCFCGVAPGAAGTFSLPQSSVVHNVTQVIRHPSTFDMCAQCSGGGENSSISDVAVILFDPPITTLAMVHVPDVFLGESHATLFGQFPEGVVFFQTGFGGTAQFDSDLGAGIRRTGRIDGLGFHYPAFGGAVCGYGGYTLDAPAHTATNDSGGSTAASGDSGGGVFAVPLQGGVLQKDQAVLVGVTSGYNESPFGVTQYKASTGSRPICQSGFLNPNCTSNAALILQGLGVDVDEDSVDDEVDNCPPAQCTLLKLPIAACDNPTQADVDGDGVGDPCDPCPNDTHNVRTLDGDFWGDACDVCPHDWDTNQDDSDGDGVGDACDSCPNDPGNPYPTCFVQADCPGAVCVFTDGSEHCSRQLDDEDGDGLGAVCDGCPLNPVDGTLGLLANSNLDAEELMPALAVLPDACDDVPQIIAKPIVYDLGASCQLTPNHPVGSCQESVEFAATRSFGTPDGSLDAVGPADAGFRHCDCFTPDVLGAPDPRAKCRQNCGIPNFNDYAQDPGASSTPYKPVTMATDHPTQFPLGDDIPFSIPQGAPHLTGRTFDSTPTTDSSAHPNDFLPGSWELETARIGTPERLAWRVQTDIDVNPFIVGHGPDADETLGLFWSLVLPTNSPFSTRDAASAQFFRTTLSMVQTPLFTLPSFGVPITVNEQGCPPNCGLFMRPDLPYINPVDAERLWPTKLPARITENAGQFILSGGPEVLSQDASPFVSDIVMRLLVEGTTRFAGSVEPGVVSRLRGTDRFFVAVPEPFSAARPVLDVVLDDGVLCAAEEVVSPPPRTPASLPLSGPAIAAAAVQPSPLDGLTRVPSPRAGALRVYSERQGALFLLGGTEPVAGNTGEVWRFDLNGRFWEPEVFIDGAIESAQAATYDSANHWLVVLDQAQQATLTLDGLHLGPPDSGAVCHKGKKSLILPAPAVAAHVSHGDAEGFCAGDGVIQRTRLWLLDRTARSASVVAQWAGETTATAIYARLALTARQDGSFLLFGTRADAPATDVFRFELTATELTWTGEGVSSGTLLDEPVLMVGGRVVAPMNIGGMQHMVVITDGNLSPATPGPGGF